MWSMLLGMLSFVKKSRSATYIIITLLVVAGGILGINYVRSEAAKAIETEKQRQADLVDSKVDAALAVYQLDNVAKELTRLQQLVAEEQQARERLTGDLLQLRTATEQQVSRIRNRQQTLERRIKENPAETAKELSEEYNELNKRLKKAIADMAVTGTDTDTDTQK